MVEITIKIAMVKPARSMVKAISLGAFWRVAPSTKAIILSKKLSPISVVTFTTILSDKILVPPVTEVLSPPASLITGALSPVIALSSILAIPSIISPSEGMVSPATQTKISPFFKEAEDTTVPSSKVVGVDSRVFLRFSACDIPLLSAKASAKLAKNKVINKIKVTQILYQNCCEL